jgi:hypothetical protein
MMNISETQIATCRKVEKHKINYSAGEVTKASSSTVVQTILERNISGIFGGPNDYTFFAKPVR